MPAFSKNKQEKPQQILNETPEEILRRRRALEGGIGDIPSATPADEQPEGLAAEKPVGALCFLPKSIHRLATRFAEDKDLTAKRFFLETLLIGLEQQGVITAEQRAETLKLPNEYGWKGRKQ